MDRQEVDKFFDFYVPEFDFKPSCQTEKPSYYIFPDLSFILAFLTALTFFRIFCKIKHRWLVSVQCSFCNCIARVWRGGIHWWYCKCCERINGFTKIKEDSENLKNYITNYEKTIESPVSSYVKENFEKDKRTADTASLTKIIQKKLMENDLKMRFELLNAERRLGGKIKELDYNTIRKIYENPENNRNAQCDEYDNRTLLCKRANCKRNSISSNAFDYSIKDLNLWLAEEKKKANLTKDEATSIIGKINHLKALHLNEMALLREQISEKEEINRKLDEVEQQIIKLYLIKI